MMIFMVFFLVASIALTYSISRGLYAELQGFRLLYDSKQSYLAAESGIEDMAYRFIASIDPDSTETITIGGVTVLSTHTHDAVEDAYTVVSEAVDNSAYRTSEVQLYVGAGASFNYGVQTGQGGVLLENGSDIMGNLFSNGTIVGDKNGGGTWVYGSIISAGPGGLVQEMHATGSVWAHTIVDSIVDENAYADTIVDSVINGDAYADTIDGGEVWGIAEYNIPLSTPFFGGGEISPAVSVVEDMATASMPITDETIELWEDDIESKGVIASTDPECSGGTYIISSDTELGPVKIECHLTIEGSQTDFYLTGDVWVTGNVTIDQIKTFNASTSMARKTALLIADNRNERSTSSKFTVAQTEFVEIAGDDRSNIKLVSMNDDAENSGPEIAFTLTNSISGNVSLYAPHGAIELNNNQTFESLTGYQIYLRNGADVVYDSGLKNEFFDSGPGGGYTIVGWREIE